MSSHAALPFDTTPRLALPGAKAATRALNRDVPGIATGAVVVVEEIEVVGADVAVVVVVELAEPVELQAASTTPKTTNSKLAVPAIERRRDIRRAWPSKEIRTAPGGARCGLGGARNRT